MSAREGGWGGGTKDRALMSTRWRSVNTGGGGFVLQLYRQKVWADLLVPACACACVRACARACCASLTWSPCAAQSQVHECMSVYVSHFGSQKNGDWNSYSIGSSGEREREQDTRTQREREKHTHREKRSCLPAKLVLAHSSSLSTTHAGPVAAAAAAAAAARGGQGRVAYAP